MPKHTVTREKLKWASRYGDIASKHPEAIEVGLFTQYPYATINRAEAMGYNWALETLKWPYRPFKYVLYIL